MEAQIRACPDAKTALDLRERLEAEAKEAAEKLAVDKVNFGDPIDMKYQAVFFIPDAQFVIFDQINKKYYVQTSAHKES